MGVRQGLSNLVLAALAISEMCLAGAEVAKYSPQLSLGVYKEELTKPIFYETFVPFIYEYTVPVYRALDVTLRDWRGKCDTDNVSPSYTCPIFFHFEKLLERFENEVVPKAWVAPTGSSLKTAAPSAVRNVEDFCNSIQRHFVGSITQQFSFEKYIDELRACPAGELTVSRGIDDYVFNVKAIFKKMNDNYEAEFSNKFFGETNKKTGPAFYVNAVTSHQNGLLLFYWVEKTRWTQAQLACNQQNIPEFLLKHQNLSKSMEGLSAKLSVQNQMTALPVEQVSAFYKLPLADCTFVENTGSFVVRVFIPVIRKDMEPKLYRLRTVPFLYKDESEKQQVCQLKPIQGKFIHDPVTGVIQSTECESESLCLIKGQMTSSVDLCVRSIFANSTQGVRKHCPFECSPISETFNVLKLPVFSRVSSDEWVITGGPSSGVISVKCAGKQDETLEPLSYGGLSVKLPCECSLAYRSEIFYVESPCKSGVDLRPLLTQLTPVHFFKEETLKDFESGRSSIQNYSLPENTKLLPESAKQRLDGSEMGEGQGQVVKVITKESSSGGAHLGVLWALVILQLCVITVLVAAAAYKYSKYRSQMSYSKERLVYNIYASPSNDTINETGTRPPSSVTDNVNAF